MNFFNLKIGEWFRFVPTGPPYEKVGISAFRFAKPPKAGPFMFRDRRPRLVVRAEAKP